MYGMKKISHPPKGAKGKKKSNASTNSGNKSPVPRSRVQQSTWTVPSTGKVVNFNVHRSGATPTAIENYNTGRGTSQCSGYLFTEANKVSAKESVDIIEFGIMCENNRIINQHEDYDNGVGTNYIRHIAVVISPFHGKSKEAPLYKLFTNQSPEYPKFTYKGKELTAKNIVEAFELNGSKFEQKRQYTQIYAEMQYLTPAYNYTVSKNVNNLKLRDAPKLTNKVENPHQYIVVKDARQKFLK